MLVEKDRREGKGEKLVITSEENAWKLREPWGPVTALLSENIAPFSEH